MSILPIESLCLMVLMLSLYICCVFTHCHFDMHSLWTSSCNKVMSYIAIQLQSDTLMHLTK